MRRLFPPCLPPRAEGGSGDRITMPPSLTVEGRKKSQPEGFSEPCRPDFNDHRAVFRSAPFPMLQVGHRSAPQTRRTATPVRRRATAVSNCRFIVSAEGDPTHPVALLHPRPPFGWCRCRFRAGLEKSKGAVPSPAASRTGLSDSRSAASRDPPSQAKGTGRVRGASPGGSLADGVMDPGIVLRAVRGEAIHSTIEHPRPPQHRHGPGIRPSSSPPMTIPDARRLSRPGRG